MGLRPATPTPTRDPDPRPRPATRPFARGSTYPFGALFTYLSNQRSIS